ncbi:TPA: ParB/RepB/Spo0J family partition protein [Kluyvera intermedia]|jgi:ParB family chromosome partitioning protein|uniref:Chromosome partitioning protein ParB n=5 Tax=Enterobacteriaceae TaxID=543 RepID=A0AAC8QJM9_9ENTR|nr:MULTISPECIES: ParB family protein [Enterobacteriaceae]AUU93149.1 chromosome partitioning protein ParB [Enterobacteriaceae bacterium ENNIH3]AUV04443.1 chromosome partitioning protein ParB [Enterobacteriaceae bacterium ENNIH1]AUV04931.1 chromosome partitioning protein ParB [Enterobacteriaceae bacterium ENNIH2]MDU7199638.1 ParB family protein [Enterobacteriaceae bacterium]PWF48226.1 ParB/RepB/Spo0J family partition protein [[Kluyvera] intestini]RDT50224.1 ParB/RepB/Spo0J family partition prot
MSRKTIGRQLNTQLSVEPTAAEGRTQIFTLKTGRKVKFSFMTVPASDVSTQTFVKQETNGRDQAALTKESLKDIIKTIKLQQFFPCIGVTEREKIEILDGSRRRAAAIFVHAPLDVMTTTESLTYEEARQLAKDIQTAKEHNLREIGLRLLAMKETGLSQKQIAEQEGLSQAKVTRAMQAAAVPQELISLFPIQSELSFSDYKALLDIDLSLSQKQISYQVLVENIASQLDSIIADDSFAEDEQKNAVLKLISKTSLSLVSPPLKDKAVVTPLWDFDEKDKFARKKIKGRNLTYEFNRMSKEVQNDIDNAIESILKKHFSS